MRISTLTRATGLAVGLAVLAVIGVAALNLDRIKIGGSQYDRLIENKDMTADILPPPLYVLESYAHALAVDTPEEVEPAAERIRKLREEFDARLLYWRDRPIDPKLRSLLYDRSAPAAKRFWAAALDGYLPAVAAGDPAAIAAARIELKAAYGAQRAVVDAMVPLAAEGAASREAAAKQGVMQTQWAVGALMLLLAGLALANLMIVARRVTGPLSGLKDFMLRMAAGDLSRDPPDLNRRDEVGDMARAVQVFRRNALDLETSTQDRLAAEQAATETQARADSERLALAEEQRRALDVLAGALNRLADADMTSRIGGLPPAYEALQADFNRALEVLGQTLGSVVEVVGQFQQGTEQLSEASDSLSRRTERQAASLEQTAAALDQLTVTVRQAAGAAAQAAELAAAARGEASASEEVVGRAVTAMGAISGSSDQIARIIGVVDEIAFQTNLLALNAGVEAARAGDSGKGFAVVAQEVRALAQRSAEAAQEIKGLITDSSGHVKRGADLVGETGRVLGAIAARVAQIDELVAGMAAASREQAASLQEVNLAVNEMDQVTQANAAMVEQSTAAILSLKGDADQLRSVVGAFRLTGGEPSAATTTDQPERFASRTRLAG